MSRSTEEWIAKNDDQAIPARVKVRVFSRCNGRCCECGVVIVGAIRPEFDHVVALVNGGSNRESNIQCLCQNCHSVKSKSDVAQKATTYRKHAKHIGLKKPRTIRSWRKFNGEIVHASKER